MSRYQSATDWLYATGYVGAALIAVRLFRTWVSVQENPAAAMAVADLNHLVFAMQITFWIGLAMTGFAWARARWRRA